MCASFCNVSILDDDEKYCQSENTSNVLRTNNLFKTNMYFQWDSDNVTKNQAYPCSVPIRGELGQNYVTKK